MEVAVALARFQLVSWRRQRSIQFRTNASPFRMSEGTLNRECDPEFGILEIFL
jgi:hypothetical protein